MQNAELLTKQTDIRSGDLWSPLNAKCKVQNAKLLTRI